MPNNDNGAADRRMEREPRREAGTEEGGRQAGRQGVRPARVSLLGRESDPFMSGKSGGLIGRPGVA